MLNHFSLFSGIGGPDLAAEWAGFITVGQCEWADYQTKVLEKHWPAIPRWRDIRSVTRESFRERTGLGTVDLISGGFPCQAHSTASHGRKTAVDLSGEFVRVVDDIRPKYAIGENVARQIIEDVAGKLQSIGYGTAVIDNTAYDAGADHIRHRWWAVAYPNDKSELPGKINEEMAIMRKISNNHWNSSNYTRVFRVPDGLPHRMDRLECLGNAIVPHQVYPILKAIAEIESKK